MEREIFSHIQARYRTVHLAPTTLNTMFVQQQQQQQQRHAMPPSYDCGAEAGTQFMIVSCFVSITKYVAGDFLNHKYINICDGV